MPFNQGTGLFSNIGNGGHVQPQKRKGKVITRPVNDVRDEGNTQEREYYESILDDLSNVADRDKNRTGFVVKQRIADGKRNMSFGDDKRIFPYGDTQKRYGQQDIRDALAYREARDKNPFPMGKYIPATPISTGLKRTRGAAIPSRRKPVEPTVATQRVPFSELQAELQDEKDNQAFWEQIEQQEQQPQTSETPVADTIEKKIPTIEKAENLGDKIQSIGGKLGEAGRSIRGSIGDTISSLGSMIHDNARPGHRWRDTLSDPDTWVIPGHNADFLAKMATAEGQGDKEAGGRNDDSRMLSQVRMQMNELNRRYTLGQLGGSDEDQDEYYNKAWNKLNNKLIELGGMEGTYISDPNDRQLIMSMAKKAEPIDDLITLHNELADESIPAQTRIQKAIGMMKIASKDVGNISDKERSAFIFASLSPEAQKRAREGIQRIQDVLARIGGNAALGEFAATANSTKNQLENAKEDDEPLNYVWSLINTLKDTYGNVPDYDAQIKAVELAFNTWNDNLFKTTRDIDYRGLQNYLKHEIGAKKKNLEAHARRIKYRNVKKYFTDTFEPLVDWQDNGTNSNNTNVTPFNYPIPPDLTAPEKEEEIHPPPPPGFFK